MGMRWRGGRAARWFLPALMATACGGGDAPPPPQSTGGTERVEFRADTATVTMPLALPAQVYVEHDAVVAARSAGVIESLFVDIGAPVAAGTRLARIERVDQELAVAVAEAAVTRTERALTRARALRDVQGVSAEEAEEVEFAHRTAELELRQARRALELTDIVAPFAGRVTARYVQPRRLVVEGDTLFRVAEAAPLLARVRVPEPGPAAVRAGGRVQVRTAANREVPGTIVMVAPTIDPGSGTREVIVRLDAANGVMPGSTVTVLLGSETRQVLAVPRDAVGADGFVLVRDGDRVAMRAVVLGQDLAGGRVEVLSGLSGGERLARPDR